MIIPVLIILPLIIPLAAVVLNLMAWRYRKVQYHVSLLALIAHTLCSALLVSAVAAGEAPHMVMGNWPSPFGIEFRVDMLSALMLLITGFVGIAALLLSRRDVPRYQFERGYYIFYNALIMGVSGAFLTHDLFNLYVWFEVMIIASFALMACTSNRQQLHGTLIYVIMNLLGTTLFLMGVGVIYGHFGALNYTDIMTQVTNMPDQSMHVIGGALLALGFTLKAAGVPLHFWLPAAYHLPSATTSAIFSALLTKVGVYTLFRLTSIMFMDESVLVSQVFTGLAIATMIVGIVGAMCQYEVRRILSFHIISQVGYMLVGLALMTAGAMMAGIFYVLHHIIVKTNLFIIAGVMERVTSQHDIRKMHSLAHHKPWLAVMWLIPALSLVGIPPLSGFWAKLSLLLPSIDGSLWVLAVTMVVVGLLTGYSMLKIWSYAYLQPASSPEQKAPWKSHAKIGRSDWLAMVMLNAVTLSLTIYPGWLFALTQLASQQLGLMN